MPAPAAPAGDDRLTIAFIAAFAYIIQNILHEAVGHGVTAWLSGAHHLTLTTVALASDVSTRWISANGTVVNLVCGAICWLLLRRPQYYRPATHYFLVLTMAGNLFTGTGYFLFSGVANFGDWADVIRGLEPHWLAQLGLVLVGAPAYILSVALVARALGPFDRPGRRIRVLSWTPYVVEAALAAVAGLRNPFGFVYVISSALASTCGANAGLWLLPTIVRRWLPRAEPSVGDISRSAAWITAGAVASLFFIGILGRGLTWTR